MQRTRETLRVNDRCHLLRNKSVKKRNGQRCMIVVWGVSRQRFEEWRDVHALVRVCPWRSCKEKGKARLMFRLCNPAIRPGKILSWLCRLAEDVTVLLISVVFAHACASHVVQLSISENNCSSLRSPAAEAKGACSLASELARCKAVRELRHLVIFVATLNY